MHPLYPFLPYNSCHGFHFKVYVWHVIIQLFKFKIILNEPSDLEAKKIGKTYLADIFLLALLNNSVTKKIFDLF